MKKPTINYNKNKVTIILFLLFIITNSFAQLSNYPPADQVAIAFKHLLHRPIVGFNPSFKIIKTDSVIIEKGFIYSEANERVPILIYKPTTKESKPFPVVVFLHGTGGSQGKRF